MDDIRTPLEAEVQELPPQREPCCPEDFYGTAVKPKLQRSHTWLWVCLGLLVITACTFSVVVTVLHVRADTRDGSLRLSFRDQEETRPPVETVQNLEAGEGESYVPSPGADAASIRLRTGEDGGEGLTAREIYARTAPSVVCVEFSTYYGSSVSTGVVITSDGYLLSASDSYAGAASITVTLPDGTELATSRVGQEQTTGLCLLKVEASDLTAAVFAFDETPAVGDEIYCLCNPYGSQLQNVFYSGMLSLCQTVEVGKQTHTLLQSDLGAVGYGCPLLDGEGRVLGITCPVGKRLISGTDPCLAVSADGILQILIGLEPSGTSESAWLGLEVEDIPEDYQLLFGYPGSLWIAEVSQGTAPYGVLYQYDVILAVDGTEVSSAEEYRRLVAQHAPGDRVRLTIYRSGQRYTILLPVLSR